MSTIFPDRRNIEDLHRLVREINEKGCAIHFVKENLHFSGDKNDPTQELLLSMLGAVYQFERAIMRERQREGIAVAKAAGKFKGRPKSIDNHEIRRILAEGNSISKTANLLGVSMSSVQRAKRGVVMNKPFYVFAAFEFCFWFVSIRTTLVV